MAGLTALGFDVKTRDQILSDMEGKQLAGISPALDIQPTDPIGVLNGIVADEAFSCWQAIGAVYDGGDPDEAVGDQLTGVALLTGTQREGATKTQVLGCTVNVNPGTYLAGTLVAAVIGSSGSKLFSNKSDVVNSSMSAANETVDFQSVNTGAIQCLAGTLTVIAQPVSGWNSVTNPTDGLIGSGVESDADLRIKRAEELQQAGSTTAGAIKADVLSQMQPPTTSSATTSCTVLYNDTDVTDANGLPPHSIEVVARQEGSTSADDLALATLILDDKAAGIGTHGNSSKSVVDSQGNSETVYFTRPTDVVLTIAITVLTDPTKFPSNGAALVKFALALYANGPSGFDGEYQPGVEVILDALKSSVYPNPGIPGSGVPGVVKVTAFTVNAGTSDIPISVRQVAVVSTGSISVTVT
jgi:hypothetical protein